MSFEPDQRGGRPAELRDLLYRHPRAAWPTRETPETRLWLGIHDGFRRAAVSLTALGEDFHDERLRAPELAVVAGARLRALVSALHGHHEVEDHHYFPILRESNPRLAKGFELLERDHVALAEDIPATLTALGELTASAGGDARPMLASRQAAERFVSLCERLQRRLLRHLEDEEDLVIPLLLERA